jgi:phosphatidylserine synthase
MAPRPSQPRLRIYSILFVVGLFVVTLAFVLAATSASREDRGGYVGMAILWGCAAVAAAALLAAIDRKRGSG